MAYKHLGQWLLPMLMGGAAMLAGCSTDKNYDFDNVDLTLGIGG